MKQTLIILMIVAWTCSVEAASMVTDVTPENVSQQPLQIRVESENYSTESVSFRVFVSSGQARISPFRGGRFEVAGKPLVEREGPMGGLPTPVLWCDVAEREEAGSLEYSFGVPRDALPQASFTFRNGDPHGMPSFDGYRLLLEPFAPKE